MSTGKTEFVALNQWEAEDDFIRVEFNEDNAKIDEAFQTLYEAMETESARVDTALNGKAASSHGTHVSYGTSASALGTSSAGSAATVSRSDHVHALPALTSCTGTLTVAKGGTGKTSFTANRLIYPSASTTMNQLAFPSVAGSVLRQGTSGAPYWTSLADLLTALNELGGLQIATGSYAGTGTGGSSNPCTLTFGFTPKYFAVSEFGGTSMLELYAKPMSGTFRSGGSASSATIVTASNGTLSWYGTSANYQCNASGKTYYYVAIG